MRIASAAFVVACLTALGAASLAHPKPADTFQLRLLLRDGSIVEGKTEVESIKFELSGTERDIPLKRIRSIQLGAVPTSKEADKIAAGLEALAGKDRAARDTASEQLAEIGPAAVSQLLAVLKDTELAEPYPIYRVFAKLVPAGADTPDRTLDLLRVDTGGRVRGKLITSEIALSTGDGKSVTTKAADIRGLWVQQKRIERTVNLHALHHTTPIDFMDTGLVLSSSSKITSDATGWVRLSFDVDGWSSDPDGLKVPGPNYKTNLVDGYPFGALVGRMGATGTRWLAGKHVEKTGLTGRLYIAVNDNPHWQNNIGGFKVKLIATDCYDTNDGV
jgi:hypothetical protein